MRQNANNGSLNVSKRKVSCLIIPLVIISAILFIFAYIHHQSKPIYIGFIGGLTGRTADLGIAGRNGTQLAVEIKNEQGGINGHKVVLLVEDIKQTADMATKAVERLARKKAAAIVGPMTSSMAVSVVPVINEHQIFTISPTVSTNELTGQDDFFYRVYPYSAQTTQLLAKYVFEEKDVRTVMVIYDATNRAHTESNYLAFKEAFESFGGKIAGHLSFLSGADIDFSEMAQQVAKVKPDCLYLLTNAMDSAFICQQLHKIGQKQVIISSDWSLTEEIIGFGGQAVEGITALHTIDRECRTNEFLQFKKHYRDRFGTDPGFAAIHAYDATIILLQALELNQDSHEIRETIRQINSFEGLQTTILFDQFGDVTREHFVIFIQNGEFQTLK